MENDHRSKSFLTVLSLPPRDAPRDKAPRIPALYPQACTQSPYSKTIIVGARLHGRAGFLVLNKIRNSNIQMCQSTTPAKKPCGKSNTSPVASRCDETLLGSQKLKRLLSEAKKRASSKPPYRTNHVSPPFCEQLRARPLHVSVQKNSQTISFSSHSVADSRPRDLLRILVSHCISYKCLLLSI